MSRAQFEYDEVGNTFYYVIVSFYALVLIPITFLLWPSSKKDSRDDGAHCNCEGCIKKFRLLRSKRPWIRTKKAVTVIFIVAAWMVFFFVVYKVSQIEQDYAEYDPYAILGVDQGSPVAVIKKRYYELSKSLHPDRGGDPMQFDRIAKAYQALTDEKSRENWEKYGNPDGPTATTFGIALPKWIVSKEYGLWVLAFYGFVLMVILPFVVGFWWYNSIKYSVDQVLMDTTQMYYYFFYKTPKMEINRILMVLGGSFEFWKTYNKDIIERESDDFELPPLMKQFRNLGENKKEQPLSKPYSIKARLLIHAHLSRFNLPSQSIRIDSDYIITKCVMLVNEMLSVYQHLYFYGNAVRCPSFETIENLSKLLPMIVQGMWQRDCPLLQLPHITEKIIYYLRKNRVKTCTDLANLDESKRRQVLQSLSGAEYRDVISVLQSMPKLNVDPHFEVQGEDDAHEVTVGSIVTLKVILSRKRLLDPDICIKEEYDPELLDAEEEEDNEDKELPAKRKVWEKPKKKGNRGKIVKNRQQQRVKPVKKTSQKVEENDLKLEELKKMKVVDEEDVEESAKEYGSDSSDGEQDADRKSASNDEGANDSDGEQWMNENFIKKETLLESKSKKTHPVHCPFYPGEKFEWWWLFLVDKKLRRLVVPGVHCTTLFDEQMVEIKFAAPQQKGIYYYYLVMKSDSYMDCDHCLDLKLDVKKAKEMPLVKYIDSSEEKGVPSSDEYTEASDSEHD